MKAISAERRKSALAWLLAPVAYEASFFDGRLDIRFPHQPLRRQIPNSVRNDYICIADIQRFRS